MCRGRTKRRRIRPDQIRQLAEQPARLPGLARKPSVPIRRMQATIYFVDEWDEAIAFYRDVLGLNEVVNFADRWALFAVPGGGSIALQPRFTDAANHVSIEVAGIKDFVAELRSKGAKVIDDVCQQEHGETALIEDPSGNLIGCSIR
jgi:catechol 2,3-dioxygenase-like lactoylglutathione lyase family enzyme